jgi:hypothetical protein
MTTGSSSLGHFVLAVPGFPGTTHASPGLCWREALELPRYRRPTKNPQGKLLRISGWWRSTRSLAPQFLLLLRSLCQPVPGSAAADSGNGSSADAISSGNRLQGQLTLRDQPPDLAHLSFCKLPVSPLTFRRGSFNDKMIGIDAPQIVTRLTNHEIITDRSVKGLVRESMSPITFPFILHLPIPFRPPRSQPHPTLGFQGSVNSGDPLQYLCLFVVVRHPTPPTRRQ